jgi:hypothetical protein
MAERFPATMLLERLNHKILVKLTPALTGFTGTTGTAF